MGEFLFAPNMIMIGSFGRNSGKTEFASALLRKWSGEFPVAALKVTTFTGDDNPALSPADDYLLIEDSGGGGGKDTARLFSAGAQSVYWLRAAKQALLSGFQAYCKKVGGDTLIICESNSLRQYVKPGCFILLKNKNSDTEKPTATAVSEYADIVFENDAVSTDLGQLTKLVQVESIGCTVTARRT